MVVEGDLLLIRARMIVEHVEERFDVGLREKPIHHVVGSVEDEAECPHAGRGRCCSFRGVGNGA